MYPLINIKDAEALFDNELREYTACYGRVLLVDGDLKIDGDFKEGAGLNLPDGEDWFEVLIAVTGNLIVSKSVLFHDCYPGLFVKGNITATSIESGDCEMICRGVATVKTFILGHGNDGRLDMDADVPFVISERGHGVGIASTSALFVDNEDANIPNYLHDIAAVFVPEVVSLHEDKRATLNSAALYERICDDLPVFLDGYER